MPPFPFSPHIWLMFFAVNVANALILKYRSRTHIRQNPGLAQGYRRFFWGYLILFNLPLLPIGIGIETGHISNFFDILHPLDGNPFIIAFLLIVVALWLLGFYWLFARRGAEFLIEHPGLLQNCPKDPRMIKLFYCLMVAAGVVALIFMSTADFLPFPRK